MLHGKARRIREVLNGVLRTGIGAVVLAAASQEFAVAQDPAYSWPGGPAIRAASASDADYPVSGYGTDLDARFGVMERELAEQRQRSEALERELSEVKAASERAADQPAKEADDEGYTVGSDLSMKANWKNGLEIESANKDFRLHVGGRTHMDGVWLDGNDAVEFGAGGIGDQLDSVNFRRGRLRVDGTMYEVVDWVVEYEFFNAFNVDPAVTATPNNTGLLPSPTEVSMTIKQLPVVGNFRVGNIKEPIGLEHLTSSRYLDFMERSFLQDAFTGAFNNGYSPGMMILSPFEEERGTWAAGVFKNTTNPFGYGVGEGEYATTGRLTWLPWFDEASGGRYLMHLGASASYRDPDNDQLRLRSRGSLRNGPSPLNSSLANTGTFLTEEQTLVGAEGAMVLGPLLLQSEYIVSGADDAIAGGVNQGDVYFDGYYVEALYFLTGEHRAYERKTGVFGRVVPHENFFFVRTPNGPCLGRGAWQVGARYGHLDLRDAGIDGGVIQDVTLGLNWFLNPNMKLQWNYVYTDRDAAGFTSDGHINGFGMRVAHDF